MNVTYHVHKQDKIAIDPHLTLSVIGSFCLNTHENTFRTKDPYAENTSKFENLLTHSRGKKDFSR